MRLFWAEKALPLMLIILGGMLVSASIFFPSIGSIKIDLLKFLPAEIEVPLASYSFNITIDNPLIGKVVIPVEVEGSKLTIRPSEILEEHEIEISLGKLSYAFVAVRVFLLVSGMTLIVTGLAVRSILV